MQQSHWRLAAGLILLAGILSLITTVDPPGGDRRSERARSATVLDRAKMWGTLTVIDTRRHAMDIYNPAAPAVATINDPIDSGPQMDKGYSPSHTPATSRFTVGAQGLWKDGLSSESLAFHSGAVIEQIEGWIGRYPWPSLLLGMMLGYSLARRRR